MVTAAGPSVRGGGGGGGSPPNEPLLKRFHSPRTGHRSSLATRTAGNGTGEKVFAAH